MTQPQPSTRVGAVSVTESRTTYRAPDRARLDAASRSDRRAYLERARASRPRRISERASRRRSRPVRAALVVVRFLVIPAPLGNSSRDMRPGPGERSVFRDVLRRQWDARRRRSPHVGHPTFIDGLRLTNVLERHGGCVNALAWNDDATLLLSGSDDLCVCVWTTGAGFPCRGSVYTGHVNNIFSNEFVPHSGSARCVTTAGDGDVRLVDLERGVSSDAPEGEGGGSPTRTTTHPPRVPLSRRNVGNPSPHGEYRHGHERCASPPATPTSSSSPIKAECVASTCERPSRGGANRAVVVDLSVQGSTSDIAFDPTNPCLFAVGCDDPFVRVFDVRHALDVGRRARTKRRPRRRENIPALIPVVAKYSPGTACGFNTRRLQFDGVSGLAYSARGELAV